MRVVGITLVRDEADIIETTVAHHLAIGCDHVLVVDNGSTDGTQRLLSGLASSTGRVSWTTDQVPYHQRDLLTGLAGEATARGADWILPFDADEFWWVPSGRRLIDVLGGSDSGALAATLRNFVQRREQHVFRPRALLTMTRRVAVPVGPPSRCVDLVSSDAIGFVEMEYPPKLVIRAAAGLVVHEGNHGASGLNGPTEDTSEVVCLHAPIRSREHLRRRREDGTRVAEAFAPDLGWHARRFRKVVGDEDGLDREWAANSFDASGALHVGGRPRLLARDPTLRDLLSRTVFARRPIRRFVS